jgi:hypothetical protein
VAVAANEAFLVGRFRRNFLLRYSCNEDRAEDLAGAMCSKGAIGRPFPPTSQLLDTVATRGKEMPWITPLAVHLVRPRAASFHF